MDAVADTDKLPWKPWQGCVYFGALVGFNIRAPLPERRVALDLRGDQDVVPTSQIHHSTNLLFGDRDHRLLGFIQGTKIKEKKK